VTSETGTVPHARVVMSVGDTEVVAEVSGDGPVDATFKAIERMAQSHATLLLYSVNAITAAPTRRARSPCGSRRPGAS
jgi:2-isopropylmalate synthase